MKNLHATLALAALSTFCVATTSAVAAESEPLVGARVKPGFVQGDEAPDRRYDQLTEAERAAVKSRYEEMAPADEPPFPIDGQGAMSRAIVEAAKATRPHGALEIAAQVDADGVVRNVQILKASVNPRFTQAVTRILMQTKWKPAVCAGQPCAMWYPTRFEAIRRN